MNANQRKQAIEDIKSQLARALAVLNLPAPDRETDAGDFVKTASYPGQAGWAKSAISNVLETLNAIQP